ncbi:hypothetical protein AMECASPLE_005984 [Ameca splendens]|uniref:Uncharacterized protein n=1 Tax=Ameca splendens TaxID=208324 RepID=A0ABV1A6N0_9TELE
MFLDDTHRSYERGPCSDEWIIYTGLSSEQTFQSGACGPQTTLFSRKPSSPLNHSQIPAEQLNSCSLCGHTPTHTLHTQSLKSTVNQQVQLLFHHVYSLRLYNQPSGAF